MFDLPNSAESAIQKMASCIGRLSRPLRNPRIRIPLLIAIHVQLFGLIFAFSFGIRYDFRLSEENLRLLKGALPVVVATKLTVFYFARHFHGWWRYVTFSDLGSLLRASFLAMMSIVFVDYYFLEYRSQIPRLSILLDTLLTIIVIGGLRSSWRFVDEQLSPMLRRQNRRPAIMVGTDHLVGPILTSINSNPRCDLKISALVSANPNWCRAQIGNVSVVGHLSDVPAIAAKLHATDILVLSGMLSGKDLRDLMNLCNENQLQLRVIPRLEDALSGTSKIPLRPLDINDLLRREPVVLDTDKLANLLMGKRVLVTGAGGSIGSEICRQVLQFRPKQIVLLGRGENRIHAIHLELQEQAAILGVKLTQVIANIVDYEAMERVFLQEQPEIVFHAAAHKHVPLMELHAGEAIKNNVFGTKNVAELADQFGASHFVLVSSDKAVNPTSVMGASKHLAERVVHEMYKSSDTKFVIVRFGNVLGSAGSVIPIFQRQIERGGPITITDKRMTRFFMSIPEAAQLVIQAAAMSKHNEIYVLNMGEPILITQLAEDLVSLSGLPPDSIEFEFTGIRPGEKLYEELYFSKEETVETEHEKVRAAKPLPPASPLTLEDLDEFNEALNDDDGQVVRLLMKNVSGYNGNSAINQELVAVKKPR